MRGLIVALALLWPAVVQAQQAPEQKVALTLTVEQAMLVVQTLGQISCPTVQTLATCNKAVELLADIQKQVRDQQK